ncbi:TetR/AcrR family transcriptional regulator [Amycolatopsis sp. WQ 127309]|uniref:TetR/AcrR family transcriptional regulator n=1 Tax=Amycolatopsis sp. WQ 127309 TaxID=2932773 RepID=UPI001FF6664F|nr:TetR/AcrR family transcriptional regulator [Amycolatopsis sp. WQ 127309]UOZ06819.1 TetR/AcrR family transcriptional regulator [Amycolatopsis sp. WQ 127309]
MRTVRGETRTNIVEVAARLLREQGVAAVTIRAVAQAAGLQPPAIYRFFADKDALLDVVAEHAFSTYVTGKAVDETLDPVADLRAGWDAHVAFGLANAALFGLLIDPRRTSGGATAAGLAVLRARVRRVAATGRLRVTERRAVEVIHAAGTGAVLTLLAGPPDDREPGLADTMYQAVLHAILADAPAPGAVVPGLSKLTAAERTLLNEWLGRPG